MDEPFIWVKEAAERVQLSKQRCYKLIKQEMFPSANESIDAVRKSRKIPNRLFILWLEFRMKQKKQLAKDNLKLARIAKNALEKFKKDYGL